MNPKHTVKIVPVLLVTAIALAGSVSATAESTDELLEMGIYTEQTVGDLTAAIEIYTQVVENAEANRPHVAQAQFRLAICYLKRGDDAGARLALEKLILEFPEQEQLVAQARERLASAQPALVLGPVPWEDGESLTYRISLPTGKVIGVLQLNAESIVVDDRDAWKLELRKFVAIADNTYGVSRILVDRRTLQPISSTFRHGVLGIANATYGPDGVEITGGTTGSFVEIDQDVYDNEEALHLMRMLPLQPGYKTRFSLLPTWTTQVIDAGLEVTGTETCQVPAGEFESYVVDLDIGQTSWISTGPERYLVKVEAEGIVVELTKIGRIDPGASLGFGTEEFGFSSTLPPGWLSYEHSMVGRTHRAVFRLLDPEFETINSIEVDRCLEGRCSTLEQTARNELAGARDRFEAYELRQGSWTERTIDGRPAVSFVGDYKRDGEPWVQYRIYTLTDDMRFEFIFRSPVDRFEELRTDFDSVADNLEAE